MNAGTILSEEELSDIKSALTNASPLIRQLESKYKTRVLVCIMHDSVYWDTAYRVHKMLRRIPHPIEDLTIILESFGGDLNSAHKILKMLKCHVKRTRVIVPLFAKSAVSLLALGADELIMCRSAELGSIDPQVRDPLTGAFVPAHSIKEALTFIESVHDLHVKLQLTDKISPLLIGAYREAAHSSKQQLEEIFAKLDKLKDQAVITFSERFLSHGYPIDREIINSVGIKVSEPDEEGEQLISDLHETYEDAALDIYGNHPEEDADSLVLLHSADSFTVVFKSKDYTNKIFGILPVPPTDLPSGASSESSSNGEDAISGSK